MWIPPEDKDPTVFHAPTRKSMGVFGAVRTADGKMVTAHTATFNAITFQQFLITLLRHRRRSRKIIVILDNARWHHAKMLAPWLRKHRHVLTLDFLPPYSPELNQIERVWKLTRRLCTHNRYFPLLEDLITVVAEQFSLWYKPNETLRKLCAII
jgi:transposase